MSLTLARGLPIRNVPAGVRVTTRVQSRCAAAALTGLACAMTPEEAVLQLELIGHDFFVFQNGDTGDVNVVYRRRDGAYGLIEPQT